MKTSVSDLSKIAPKMWMWLINIPKTEKEKSDHEKSGYRKSFQDLHLEMAFLRMKEILSYSWNLTPKRIDEIFNAQTIELFLRKLLQNPENPPGSNTLLHNFVKTELARVMYEVSGEYLRDATDSKTVNDDLNRVSDHFMIQSENKLDNETFAEHGNEKGRTLTKKK